MSDSLNAALQDNYTLKAQLQNMSDTLMKQTCRVMSLVAENNQLLKTLEPLRDENYAYLCRTLAADKRAETAERKVIELSALLESMPELRRALDVAQAENEQLRALNEKALPLSEKEYIGALKGVPLFTHRGIQLAALATLGEIQHERADLERRLTEAKRALGEALSTIKRHEAELDSVLSKPKAEIDALKTKLAMTERTVATAMEPLTIKVKDIQVGQWLWHDATHPSRVTTRLRLHGRGDISRVFSHCGDVSFLWAVEKTADGYTLKLLDTEETPK